MATEKNIEGQIRDLETLRAISKAYAGIAAIRMKKVRNSVLYNREFMAQIDAIFRDVRSSYRLELLKLIDKKKVKIGDKITFLAHNGKTVAAFISANTGLYGDIVQRTFEAFMKEVRSTGIEVAIIGKLGLSLFLATGVDRPYSYFDFPDHQIDPDKLSEIITHLVQYEEIHVYYGRFQSVVTQKPEMLDVSAETPIVDLIDEKRQGKAVQYLFEPDLEEIMVFFEQEMFASLFEQAIRESQLAKYASRIFAMDKAGENIKQSIKGLEIDLLRAEHRDQNRKQLDSLAARIMATAR